MLLEVFYNWTFFLENIGSPFDIGKAILRLCVLRWFIIAVLTGNKRLRCPGEKKKSMVYTVQN